MKLLTPTESRKFPEAYAMIKGCAGKLNRWKWISENLNGADGLKHNRHLITAYACMSTQKALRVFEKTLSACGLDHVMSANRKLRSGFTGTPDGSIIIDIDPIKVPDHVLDPAETNAMDNKLDFVEGGSENAVDRILKEDYQAIIDVGSVFLGLMPADILCMIRTKRPNVAQLAYWDERDIVALLRTGVGARASMSGPMAEVVLHGTQYLSNPDLSAVAVYLRSMQTGSPRVTQSSAPLGLESAAGSRLYEKHCANCHGDSGEGVSGAYPALAGNRAVLMGDSRNLVQMVLRGGFAPATDGNPRPFGMPPYQVLLSDGDIAAVLTHIRGAWGNSAAALSELDVARHRGGPLR